MTDKTNPNRWTAKVGPSRYYHFKVAVVSDRGRTVPIDRLTDEQAESLAEQINRPAPTAPADDLLAKTERCLIAAETLDREHLDDMERNNADPQSRRLKEIIARRRSELDLLRPADDLPPGVERISDGTLWLVIPEPDGDTLAEMRLALLPDGWQWVHPNRTVEADEPVMVQVRRIIPAEPATEWVPWWEALRDRRTLTNGVLALDTGQPAGSTSRWVGRWAQGSVYVNDDGKVEVQR